MCFFSIYLLFILEFVFLFIIDTKIVKSLKVFTWEWIKEIMAALSMILKKKGNNVSSNLYLWTFKDFIYFNVTCKFLSNKDKLKCTQSKLK